MSFFDAIGNALGLTNPARGATDYLSQIQPQVTPYFQPYIDAGQQALPQWAQQTQQLTTSPGEMQNQFGQAFQASPGYQYNVNQATDAAKSMAAASGQAGSPAVQQALAEQISGMAAQDYNNWMNNTLGLYNQGYGGLQNQSQMGLTAGSNLSNILSQALNAQAQADFAGAQQQSQNAGGLLGGLLSFF